MYVHLAKSRDEKILSIHVGELQHLSWCQHISHRAAVCTALLAVMLHMVFGLLVRCSVAGLISKNLCVFGATAETPFCNSALRFLYL